MAESAAAEAKFPYSWAKVVPAGSVSSTTGEELNNYQVRWPDKIIFTEDAFRKLEARLGVKEGA